MGNPARILIADDEPDLIDDYQCALTTRAPEGAEMRLAELEDELFGPQRSSPSLPQLELVAVNRGEAAVQAISQARDLGQPFSAAFLDVRMPPGMSGLEAAVKIRELDSQLPIVIVTAYTDVQTIDLAKKIPPADRLFVLQKPFHTTEIQQLAIALIARLEQERAVEKMAPPQGLRELENLARALPGGIAVFDERRRLLGVNDELEMLFPEMKRQICPGTTYASFREAVSKRLLPDRVLKRSDNRLTEGGLQTGSGGGIAIRRLAGNRWMMISEQAQASGATVVQFIDITTMKVAEQQQLLTGTMAHVSRFAERIVRRLTVASRRLSVAEESDAAQALAGVNQGLLDELIPIAQRLELAPGPIILDGLINEVVGAMSPALPGSINLEVVSAAGLWPVYVDRERIKLALEALIRNAVEALEGGGSVRVDALNVRASRESAVELPGLKAGDYVCVRITDTGTGMPPEVINRAFMPYFTTKDPQTHKGMGLTLAYSIVTQSGGRFFIDSDAVAETQVRLFFPRTSMAAAAKGEAGGG